MSKENPCFIISADHQITKIEEFSKFFTLILQDIVKIKIKLIENFFSRDSFVNQNPFFEIVRTIYIRKQMPKRQKIFLNNWWVLGLFDGLHWNLFSF